MDLQNIILEGFRLLTDITDISQADKERQTPTIGFHSCSGPVMMLNENHKIKVLRGRDLAFDGMTYRPQDIGILAIKLADYKRVGDNTCILFYPESKEYWILYEYPDAEEGKETPIPWKHRTGMFQIGTWPPLRVGLVSR